MHAKLPHLLIVLLIALLILPTTATAVSETEFIINDTRYELDKKTFVDGSNTASPPWFRIVIANYQDLENLNLESVFWKPSALDSNFVLYNEDIPTETYNVYLRTGSRTVGTIIGTGHLTYYKGATTGQSYVRVDIDTINPSLMLSQTIYVSPNEEKPFNLKTVYGASSQTVPDHFRTQDIALLRGTTEIEYSWQFTHSVSLEPYDQNTLKININRGGTGTTDSRHSVVSIFDNSGNLLYTDTGSSSVSTNVDKNLQPYTVVVDSTAYGGKTYTGYLGDGEPWIPPGVEPPSTPTEPEQSASVTVYIRNSQTGALLADSHLSILAAVGDPSQLYEVVNATLPGGTGVYTLQPNGGGLPNPDYYRVIVTADGYNAEMPYADITLDAGIPMTMVMGMQPTGGAPEDPGDTYIDVYVRDIYANPIADATVKLGKYTLQTNSAGYTLFDVPVNSTYTYTVKKTGYTSIEGSVTVADAARYPVNIVMGTGVIPTNTPTAEPTGPGATPTPDRRTNEQKGQAVIDMIADNAEGIGALALICLLLGLLKLMVKW